MKLRKRPTYTRKKTHIHTEKDPHTHGKSNQRLREGERERERNRARARARECSRARKNSMYVSFLTFQDDKEKGGLSLLFRILVIKRDLVDRDARMTALKYAHNQFKSELVFEVDHEHLRRVWSWKIRV